MLMKSKQAILQTQREWADFAGLAVDGKGYVGSVEDNLYRPLSQTTRLALERGGGSELRPSRGGLPKMAALHSSAALAINVFDDWTGRPLSPLAAALHLDKSPDRFAFEATFPTGLKGTPPHLDLAFFGPGNAVVGVESKFTEWLTPKSPNKLSFRPEYFPERAPLWSAVGLAQAQRLADAMRSGEEGFRYLDAAQLLKHMLGLANVLGTKASLLYL
jgi:hypothetical protein